MWDREATDPRDQVFAVLGLVGDEAHGQLSADYGKPVGQVYQEAAACVIKAENSLDLLLAAPGLMASRRSPDVGSRLEARGLRQSTGALHQWSSDEDALVLFRVDVSGALPWHGYSASGKMEPAVRFEPSTKI
jgi:hypothetical protein